MHFEQQIENKKRQYTDKYVMVDASRPELARFKDAVGQVKTVNMSGRALVVGVTGISGGNVAQRQLEDGWEVSCLCRHPEALDALDEAVDEACASPVS